MILETFPVGPLQCNCTILAGEGSHQAIVVDPGDEAERILEHLRSMELEVTQIVCTHAHLDHVGAIHEIQSRTGASAMLHEEDMFLWDHLDTQAAWLGLPPPERGVVGRFLGDGDCVRSERIELDVLHTPGHTPGSLTFHLEDERTILFTGDTLFLDSIGRTDLPGGSMPDILDSIQSKLLCFDPDSLVIPGHGPRTTIGREKSKNPFLQ